MATTLMPLDPATSPGHATRVLTIAAHLLPDEIVASRRARRVRDLVIAVLGAFVLLLGGWYAVATYRAGQAADDPVHCSTASH